MNINPYDKAHELAHAIIGNQVYLDYLAAKKTIDKNPEYKEMVIAFRTRQIEMNRAQALGEEISKDTINEITLEFAKLNQIQEIATFMESEGRFIQMFNDLQEIIQKAIEKDLDE